MLLRNVVKQVVALLVPPAISPAAPNSAVSPGERLVEMRAYCVNYLPPVPPLEFLSLPFNWLLYVCTVVIGLHNTIKIKMNNYPHHCRSPVESFSKFEKPWAVMLFGHLLAHLIHPGPWLLHYIILDPSRLKTQKAERAKGDSHFHNRLENRY